MKHLLIINQHGENRGDEAAMRAMIARFEEELGEVRFTVLYQFRDRSLRIPFGDNVTDLPIVLPPADYLTAALFSLGNVARLDLKPLMTGTMQQIIAAYESADMVISAPGGPYFGDIYISHEIVHWWYVWLAARYNKPLYLYAPSAGPFKNKLMNQVRRRLYRKFDTLVTREEISQGHLHGLLGADTQVHVTADSAIQQSFKAFPKSEYFAGDRAPLGKKYLIAVSLNNYKYPEKKDPEPLRKRYNAAMIELLAHFHHRKDCHFLFIPQLYGKVHSDVSFLKEMGAQLPEGASWELVDPKLDSDHQRMLFSMCDLHLASRYHPAIFGYTGYTPGICIYYEHKAIGFMRQLGVERFAFDIRNPEPEKLKAAADELIDTREEIIEHLRTTVPKLQQRARRSTDLAVELLRSKDSQGV